jgi:hypothetical protein
VPNSTTMPILLVLIVASSSTTLLLFFFAAILASVAVFSFMLFALCSLSALAFFEVA